MDFKTWIKKTSPEELHIMSEMPCPCQGQNRNDCPSCGGTRLSFREASDAFLDEYIVLRFEFSDYLQTRRTEP